MPCQAVDDALSMSKTVYSQTIEVNLMILETKIFKQEELVKTLEYRHLHMTRREVRRNCLVFLRKSCSARPDLFDFPTAFFTGQTSSVVLT